jgi:outer membrane protein OmpU
MKKVLFATTALVAFAGAAAAEVKLSGYAEMGVRGGNNGADTRLHTDIDVKFSLSGETDGGLSFGATIDLDEINTSESVGGTPTSGTANDVAESVFIKGDFGTLTMGDTDGAFDWALTEVAMLTSLADDHTTHAGYNGNGGLDGASNSGQDDGLIARYEYPFGDFAVAVSVELDSDAADDDIVGLGAKWSGTVGMMDLGVGVGFQSNGARDIFGISGKLSSNGFDVVVNYSDLDGQIVGADDDHMAIGVGYTTGALSLTANYGVYDLVGGGEDKGYGLAANYDLGGGAVVMAGYGKDDEAGGGDDATWSLGLGLSF